MAAQFSEVLHIGGYQMAMCCEPLDAYLEVEHSTSRLQGWRGCARGYQGTWEIQDNRLYLVELVGTLEDGSEATLATLFPNSPERVFADWHSGPLIEPDVNRTKYVPRGDWIYDCDLFITIDKGEVSDAYVSRAGGPKDTDEVVYRYGLRTSRAALQT